MFFLEIGIAALMLGALLAVVWQFPRVLLGLVLACTVLDQLLKAGSLNLGINIYPLDAAFCLAAAVGVIRYFAKLRSLNIALTCAFALFVCTMISLLRGFSDYGVLQAGVEVRVVFYFIAGVLYFGTFRWSEQQQEWFVNAWLATAAILSLIATYRWAGQVLGFGGAWAELYGGEGRVINAAGAMFIATAFFLSLSMCVGKYGAGWQRFAFLPFGVAIVLLKHRTLWIGTAIVLVMLVVSDRRFRLRSLFALVSTMLITVLALALLPSLGTSTNSGDLSYSQAASDDKTFLWRYDSWIELLGADRSPVALAIGTPFGAGYTRYLYGQYLEQNPHNFYVLMLLRVGGVGLLLFLLVYLFSFRAVNRLCLDGVLGERSVWRAVLVLQMAYCMTYPLNYEQSILLSMVVAASQTRLVRETPRAPILFPNNEKVLG